MSGSFDRTASLIGADAFARLNGATALIVGLGGVGGAALEVLARSGIGSFVLVDGDAFEPTNLNRQLLCTVSELGKNKAEVAKTRVLSVNPEAKVTAIGEYLSQNNVNDIVSDGITYCVDAIDDVKNKVALIKACKAKNIPIVSAMGAGNRLEPQFAVTDVFKTENDPLARKFRHELRACGIESLSVVCATAPPTVKSATPLSVAAPPIVMGAMLASKVIRDLTENK